MKKFLLVMVVIVLLLVNGVWAEDTMDLDVDYTAEMIYDSAMELQEKYPDLIKVITLGYSNANRPIFVVQLTAGVDAIERDPETYTTKKHLLIEGGIHSRENPSPVVLMKTIEMYAKDYEDDTHILSINIEDILEEFVFHIIPLSNPDGYNLANFGLYTVPEPYKSKVLSFQSKAYSQYKSNLNGVDLNRNFPGEYYDVAQEKWVDIWNKEHNYLRSYVPGSGYFHGYSSGSEIETQILMSYLLAYDFRNYLSYHSKGDVIYYHKWMLSDAHNTYSETLATLIGKYTGYKVDFNNQKDSSSGYLTDYTSMQTLKPSITVETVHPWYSLPVSNYVIKSIYEEMLMVPVIAAFESKRVGYFPYRLYQEGIYIRDFEELVYAEAFAEKLGGVIIEGVGQPPYYLTEDLKPLKRYDLIQKVMAYVDAEPTVSFKTFLDTSDPLVLKARALGFVSGYNNYFRPNDDVTFEEVYVVLKNVFFKDYEILDESLINYKKVWARESVQILYENKIIDYQDMDVGKITLGEFTHYMDRIIGGLHDRVE